MVQKQWNKSKEWKWVKVNVRWMRRRKLTKETISSRKSTSWQNSTNESSRWSRHPALRAAGAVVFIVLLWQIFWFEQKWKPKASSASTLFRAQSPKSLKNYISRGGHTLTSRCKPAALFKPASDVVPHVVWLKGVEQEICCFDQLCCLLVLTKLAIETKQKDGHTFTCFHRLIITEKHTQLFDAGH